MIIRGNTKILALIGKNIKHSLSPLIHNYLINYYKLDMVYVVFDLNEKFENFYEFFKNCSNFLGCNITIPYKESAYNLADNINELAREIKAVNTLKHENEIITGYNTDIFGFLYTLEKIICFNMESKNVVILGSGGTAKTAIYALKDKVAGITIVSRSRSKIEHLLSENIKWKEFKNNKECLKFYDADIIINTTPLGINGESIDINWDVLKKELAIFDLIYFDTPLILDAKKRGFNCSNGKNMLIYQALKSFEIWTDLDISDSMVQTIKKEVFNEE